MYDITNQNHVCSAATPICVGGETRPAMEWAVIRGIKWQTLKMRRYRGMSWSEAFGDIRRGRRPLRRAA